MLTIDGSYGEGGGQILRTSLALSIITGTPITIQNIRARRPKPGLRPQHLTCVQAASAICDAETTGAEVGSMKLTFNPSSARPGTYSFDIGTAGSVMLVLQTILLPLALSGGNSTVRLTGGTHVPWSPCFHYMDKVFRRAAAEMHLSFKMHLERWGWYPRGGGVVKVTVSPCRGLHPFVPPSPRHREDLALKALSAASRLPDHVIARQARSIQSTFKRHGLEIEITEERAPAFSPGSLAFCWVEGPGRYAGSTGLGARGKPAEKVGQEASTELIRFLESGSQVDEHLSDQLVPLAALAEGESRWSTSRLTRHLETNLWVVSRFGLGRSKVEENSTGTCNLRINLSD